MGADLPAGVNRTTTRPSFDLSAGLASRVALSNGVRMPVFGLGAWKLASGPKTVEIVRTALELGYRHIDTATLYGNEREVGTAIHRSKVPREELFVTTKVWNTDQGYDSTLAAFERSRAALGDAVVDLYLIHWPVAARRLESWRALTELYREGRCRAIGVSNFTVRQLEELLAVSDVVPMVDQVEFSPFLYQRDLLEFCRAHGIQLEAYAPLTRGRRLDHPELRAIARAHARTPAQVLLRWALQHDVVVIPKTERPDRLRENAGAFEFALSPAEMDRLDRLHDGLRTTSDPESFG